jgi:hypothetical protein
MMDNLSANGNSLTGRIRVAGLLVGLGLIVELVTLLWNHPLSFLAFAFVGAPLVLAGVLVYLVSLARHAPS